MANTVKRKLIFLYLILIQLVTLWLMMTAFVLLWSGSLLLIDVALCVVASLFLFFNWLSWHYWCSVRYRFALTSSLINYVYIAAVVAFVTLTYPLC